MLTNTDKISAVKQLGGPISIYQPLPAPVLFHKSMARYRFLSGGNRSGKSESNTGYDMGTFALGVHPYRPTPPNAVLWACADTWPLVGKILWKEKVQRYIPDHQIDSIVWHNKGEEIPKELKLKTGNRVEFKAFEQGRTVFEGRAIDAIYCDEQCKNDSLAIFREMQARMESPNSFMAWSMTPIRSQPWLEDKFSSLPSGYEVFYANLNDNRISRGGYVADSVIDDLIDEWPDEVKETRIAGRFASFMGAVYKAFAKTTHVIRPFAIPESWEKWRSIDFGFNNPFVCLWAALDHDNCWYVYDEHYQRRATLGSHAERINTLSGDEHYQDTFADHDAQDRAELWDLDIFTVPAKKEVRSGIEAVQRALKIRGNGKPRLFIFDNCINTIREMGSYHYPDGTDARDPQDEPAKKDDHCLDALRYIIFGVEHDAPLIINFETEEKQYRTSDDALTVGDMGLSDISEADYDIGDYDDPEDKRSVDDIMEAAGAWGK